MQLINISKISKIEFSMIPTKLKFNKRLYEECMVRIINSSTPTEEYVQNETISTIDVI